MEIKVPLKPLSVNLVWQGRRFKTKAYKQFEQDCSWYLKGKKILGEVEIKIKFFVKNYKMCDVDNFCKPLLDIIVKQGLIEDDRKVKRLVVEKYQSGVESFEIKIDKYI